MTSEPITRAKSSVPARRPSVFISYAREEDRAFMDQVLDFSERLRDPGGLLTYLDQYESFPEQGLHRWMVNKVIESDYVLVVCTRKYIHRFEGREGGGVNWEGAIITAEMYQADGKNQKFIPVGFVPQSENPYIPTLLRPWPYFNVARADGFEELLRILWKQPMVVPTAPSPPPLPLRGGVYPRSPDPF